MIIIKINLYDKYKKQMIKGKYINLKIMHFRIIIFLDTKNAAKNMN